MHIILVSDRMATARSIRVTGGHVALIAAGLVATVLALSSLFSYLTVRHAAEIRMPFLQELLRSVSLEEAGKTRELVRDNISTMAVRLGELQGQLMQLDTLGERLAAIAGVKPQGAARALPAGPRQGPSGGPLMRPDNLSAQDMQRALDELSRQIEVRSETLAALESRIFDERIRTHLLPTVRPVAEGTSSSSSFGWRLDPFTGQTAMHEGVDFIAETGTPILAAAAGIVRTAEYHPQYGHMIEIDHGEEMATRYAHASALDVRAGEFVKRGQKIAAVGSDRKSVV